MKAWFMATWTKESFDPSFLVGIWINPFFIIRRGLANGVRDISSKLQGGKLLDVGCGRKPYEELFNVEEYVGIDIEASGHDHSKSKIDKYYDGNTIPYSDCEFDHVFSSEVFEHVFDINEMLIEINRVLKSGGYLGFTCPFVWDEHEQPYDFARYTSFAVEHLIKRHGFELVESGKSTGYFETVMQMLSAYVYQHVLPKNTYLKLILVPFIVAPINIIGIVLGSVLPKSSNYYHNNIVVAQKK